MEGVAALIAAIGGLLTAVTTAVVALVKSRQTGAELSEVRQLVTPANGESLARMVEEALEHIRGNSRRLDFHDEVLTRIAGRVDEVAALHLVPGDEIREALAELKRHLDAGED